eukprot:15431500-Alexandrium_andersonii.AAC.1
MRAGCPGACAGSVGDAGFRGAPPRWPAGVAGCAAGAGAARASEAAKKGPASSRGTWSPGLRRLVRCRSTGLRTMRNASGTASRTSEKRC